MIVGLEHWTLARPELFLRGRRRRCCCSTACCAARSSTAFVSVATVDRAAGRRPCCCSCRIARARPSPALFIVDRLTTTMKALVLVGAAIAILMSRAYFEHAKAWRFEYPLLVALATLGMMLMISANDLMSLYVGLELQSLALYVVAAFQRDTRALDRSRPEVLRPGRGRLGHAAVRRLADLRLLRRHGLRADLAGAAGRQGGRDRHRRSAWCSWSRAWPSRSRPCRSTCGRPTSTRARRRRSRRFFAVAPKIAAHLADRLGPDGPVQAAVRRSGSRSSSSPSSLSMALGRLRGAAPAQHQAPDGLLLDRQCRLRAAGPGRRQREGHPVGGLLSRDLHGHDARRLRHHPDDEAPRHHGRERLGPRRPRPAAIR